MAFPAIESSTQGSGSAQNPSITMPSGVVKGDLVVITYGLALSYAATATLIANWQKSVAVGALLTIYTIATGSEGSTVAPATFNGVTAYSYSAIRISNASVVQGVHINDTDPPSLSHNGVSDDILWLTAGTLSSGFTSALPPTDYTEIADQTRLTVAYRYLSAASENPGVFTYTGGTGNSHATLAVRPKTTPWISDFTTFYAAGTSHDIPIPGTDTSGDLVIIALCKDDDISPSQPGGWSILADAESLDQIWLTVYAIVSNGSLGSTVNIITDSEDVGAIICRIPVGAWRGAISGGLEAGSVAVATAVGITASVTPSWGIDNNLIINICGEDGNGTTQNFGNQLPGNSDAWVDNNIFIFGGAAGSIALAFCTSEDDFSTTRSSGYPNGQSEQHAHVMLAVRPPAQAVFTPFRRPYTQLLPH